MLIYSALASLDLYTADAEGKFDWAAPDEEVLECVNDVVRPVGMHLFGRRMYDPYMLYWETADVAGESSAARDFAEMWRAADKVVYSTTLSSPSSAKTRIERSFDPGKVRELKRHGTVAIGGPTLAAHAIRAGLVDEVHLFLTPVLVGGGMPVFPPDVRVPLALVSERRFGSGVVYLHYRVR